MLNYNKNTFEHKPLSSIMPEKSYILKIRSGFSPSRVLTFSKNAWLSWMESSTWLRLNRPDTLRSIIAACVLVRVCTSVHSDEYNSDGSNISRSCSETILQQNRKLYLIHAKWKRIFGHNVCTACVFSLY